MSEGRIKMPGMGQATGAIGIDLPSQISYEAPMAVLKEDLFRLVREKAYKEGQFKLASGKVSPFYFDAKKVLFDQQGSKAFARWILSQLHEMNPRPTALGGLEIGAIPIACTAVALAQFDLRAFVVRKERKAHGTGSLIEGDVGTHDHIAVVDDVITTGESTLKAIRAIEEAGAHVQKVFCLVDRSEGAYSDNFRPYLDRLCPAFTLQEFLDRVRRE